MYKFIIFVCIGKFGRFKNPFATLNQGRGRGRQAHSTPIFWSKNIFFFVKLQEDKKEAVVEKSDKKCHRKEAVQPKK